MMYPSQRDQHLANWLKHEFNLTVQHNDDYYNSKDWWRAFKGDYDLDIKEVIHGPSIFDVACEYASCYDGDMAERLAILAMGE